MSTLTLQHLAVTYAGKTALHVEHAQFQPGCLYGIVGPSGSGKSSLLRVINLLERPASGLMHFGEHSVDLTTVSQASTLSLQRTMGFVAQKPSMFQATVFDNVALGLKYRGADRATIRSRVQQALEWVELSDCANQLADTLSGGEAQRIALARAIVYEPSLLLLDEPTASLDPYNITIFERVVKQLLAKGNLTVLMVTHNLAQAKRLCDQCLLLHKGKIVEANRTELFFHSPASRELHDFLDGRMIY